MDRRYKSDVANDRLLCVGMRLIMLNTLSIPFGYTGSVGKLRRAITTDPKINRLIRDVVRLKRLELLDRCDLLEFSHRRDQRIRAIARKLSNSNC